MREHGIDDWRELRRRSAQDIEWFWDAVVRHLGIEFFTPYDRVVDTSRGPEWATWFGGGTINLTYNCVDRHARTAPGRRAVIAESRGRRGAARHLRRAGGAGQPAGKRAARAGGGAGRRVGLYLPMGLEVVVAFYAVCKIGAIAVPDLLGLRRRRRWRRGWPTPRPVALITADAVPRRGRPVSMKATADEALDSVPRRPPRHRPRPAGHRPADAAGPRPSLATSLSAGSRTDLDAPPLDPETPMMVDLHLGHHRPAQGRRARARRLPGQDRRGVRLPDATCTPDDVLSG